MASSWIFMQLSHFSFKRQVFAILQNKNCEKLWNIYKFSSDFPQIISLHFKWSPAFKSPSTTGSPSIVMTSSTTCAPTNIDRWPGRLWNLKYDHRWSIKWPLDLTFGLEKICLGEDEDDLSDDDGSERQSDQHGSCSWRWQWWQWWQTEWSAWELLRKKRRSWTTVVDEARRRRQDDQMGGDHWSLTKISKPSWKLGKLAPIDQIPEKNLQMDPREVKRLHMSPWNEVAQTKKHIFWKIFKMIVIKALISSGIIIGFRRRSHYMTLARQLANALWPPLTPFWNIENQYHKGFDLKARVPIK